MPGKAICQGAPRQQEILLVDFASPGQALVKLRVRIDTILYLDYFCSRWSRARGWSPRNRFTSSGASKPRRLRT
jgi:hypothetical protein